MLNLFSTALSLLGNYTSAQSQKRESQKFAEGRQERYEQSLNELNNLFSRAYYTNILDRSDVRGLLGNLRNQMTETTRNLQNWASVTGATPELVVATQNAQNKAYGNAVGQVASEGTAWKNDIMNNYLNTRLALEEMYQPTKSGYMSTLFRKNGSTNLFGILGNQFR